MNNFKKGGFKAGASSFGGRPKFGGGKKFGGDKKFGTTGRGHDRGDRKSAGSEMFSAVCSECRKSCEVPFRPSGDKPVFCRDCFGNKDKGASRDFRGSERASSDFRKDSRPAYREETRAPRPEHGGGNEEMKRRIESIESKINRILEYMNTQTQALSRNTVVAGEVSIPKKERKPKVDKKAVVVKKKAPKKGKK